MSPVGKAGSATNVSGGAAIPRVLVVDDEPAMVEMLRDVVTESLECQLITAGSLAEARRALASQDVQLLVADVKQPDVVRTQEGFRKTIEPAADLEQLICHAMDWMMRQTGYSNVAVWLTGEDGGYQLGAYMKYTIPGDEAVSAALRRVILPLAAR